MGSRRGDLLLRFFQICRTIMEVTADAMFKESTETTIMRKLFLGATWLAFLVFLTLTPSVRAQENDNGSSSFTLQVDEPVTIAAGESSDNVVVISGDATIEGSVEETLVVIQGVATVNGRVGGDILVIDGTLDLGPTAQVNNLTLFSSDLVRADGAVVSGEINESFVDFSLGFSLVGLLALWWAGVGLVTVLAGVVFAWLGRDQLYGTVQVLRTRFVPSLVTALLLWIVLPIAAAFLLITVVGIPLSLTVFGLLLPLLMLIGFGVMGAWIGSYILKPDTTNRGIGSTAIGVLILIVISIIPFVIIFVGLAAMLGSGGFVYRAVTRAGGEDSRPSALSDQTVGQLT